MNNINQLADVCVSDDLSLNALQEIINRLGPLAASQSCCFHHACGNENVTLKIIQLLYNTFPGALLLRDDDGWLPIHRLCSNKDLDDANSLEILRFMLSIDPTLPRKTDGDDYLPIHHAVCYKSAAFCKELIDAYPESLRMELDDGLPIHRACRYGTRDDTADTIQYMLELDPELINEQNDNERKLSSWEQRGTVTSAYTRFFQLLYNTFPGALLLRDDDGWLPIHRLCSNKDLDDANSLEILRFMLSIDPTLPRKTDGDDYLPIHHAVCYKSAAFCKELIDAYPESLRMELDDGLPIHRACRYGTRDDTADTIQYMLELDPELINAQNDGGWLPINHAAWQENTKAIELLLKFDPDAASKEVNDESRRLSLHVACNYNTNLSSIQVLYDAYPEAIDISDEDGDTPLDTAQEEGNQQAIEFLQTQLVYARQAQDMTAMTTVDENGWLPLHRALNNNASLGSIKLLVKGNPAALQVADRWGAYSLHIGCKFSSAKVVKYLVQCNQVILNHVDANKDSPLHYACRGGSLSVLKYLLEANVPSVSERNNGSKLAIHLLLECGENTLDRESMEYVETVWQLLLANPEVVRDFMQLSSDHVLYSG